MVVSGVVGRVGAGVVGVVVAAVVVAAVVVTGGGADPSSPVSLVRGSVKKLPFLLLVKKTETPPSLCFDYLSFFIIRIFWIGQDPPP